MREKTEGNSRAESITAASIRTGVIGNGNKLLVSIPQDGEVFPGDDQGKVVAAGRHRRKVLPGSGRSLRTG